jgi:hypothetical protein
MGAGYRKRLWGLISQAPYNALSDEDCLATINDKTELIIVPNRVHERDLLTMFNTLNDGETFLQKLETGALDNDILKRCLRWFLPSEDGIDTGHAKTRAMLDALVGLYGITQSEVDTVKASANRYVSPAEKVGLGLVRLGNVILTRQIYS